MKVLFGVFSVFCFTMAYVNFRRLSRPVSAAVTAFLAVLLYVLLAIWTKDALGIALAGFYLCVIMGVRE